VERGKCLAESVELSGAIEENDLTTCACFGEDTITVFAPVLS
jgi:hypothetical protein